MGVAGRHNQGTIRLAGLRPHWIGLFALLLAGCAKESLPDRTIIDQSGTVAGEASVRQPVQLQAGDRLQIVLTQSGIDVHLSVEDPTAHVIGRFDSQTGRHGEERAVISIARSGEYALIVSAARPARVPGSYRIIAATRSESNRADEEYSRASDLTVNIDYRERIQLFQSAAQAFEADGRSRESGLAFLAATSISVNRLSDAARSESLGKRAVRAFRDTSQSALLADALTLTAAMVAERNLTREVPGAASRAEFEPMMLEARSLHEANGFPAGVAETNLYLGVALGAAGFGGEAIALWESSRSACHELGDAVCEAQALGSLGAYAGDVPDYPSSFESLYRAAALLSERVDPATLAEINVNLAFVLGKANHHDEAIERHRMALRDFEAAGECVGMSRAHYGIGYSLLGVGDYDQAVRFFRQAMDRDCRGKQPRTQAADVQSKGRSFADLCAAIVADEDQDFEVRKVAMWSAWDLGNLARSRGDLAGAAVCHRLAARVAPTENTRLGTNLERIEDLILRGDAEAAQREFAPLGIDFSKSTPPRDGGHAWYLAHARELWARLLLARGATHEAFVELSAAAADYEERGNQEGRFDTLRTLGQLAQQSGRPQQSADYFAQADGVLESFRIATLNPSHRAMLFEARRGLYTDWIGAARAGPQEEMLDLLISERSRSRILTELAGSYVVDAQERAARLRFDRPTRTAAVSDDAAATVDRPRFWELTSQSQSFDGAARRKSRNELLSYQRSLSEATTVVEFLLGEHDSDAWVMRRDSLHRVKLAGIAAIGKAAGDVHAALSGNADLAANRRALGELYRLVVAPLMPYVAGNSLLIAADDVLHGVPFAALWDEESGQYLVQKMSISMLPSLQFSVARRNEQRAQAESAALLVGDPVYEWKDAQRRCDITSSDAGEQGSVKTTLRRIPASAKEVDGIGALLAARDIDPDVLVGCAATREAVIARLPRRYRILHFATHATADTEMPERSAIHLAAFDSNGRAPESSLSAADLFERRIDADLVVLSGCSSADGRRFAGDGTLGLTFAVLAAGGRNVVSSLWPIADEASVLAMQAFYAALVRDNLTPNEALRRAQLALLEKEAWREPRYWGGYVLTGG